MENCKGNINNFCYICGRFTPANRKPGSFSEDLKLAYQKYFDQTVISGVPWVPNITCKTCYNSLLDWLHHKRKSMPFGVPMIWIDPIQHDPSNCYACVNTVHGLTKKNMKKFKYKGVASAQIPLPHSEHNPPKLASPDVLSPSTLVTVAQTELETVDHSLFDPGPSALKEPVLIKQDELDTIVASLNLTQRKSEELASFLNARNLLAPGTRVSVYRKRQSDFQNFFMVNEDKTYAYCNDVDTLMVAMDIEYKPEEWRLFIDSSSTSLKAVLLHVTNSKPSIPVAYSTETKETYDVLKTVLNSIDYEKHQWKICCDLKVVAMLCGLQSGYTKYMCFMCDWDSRYKGNQYTMNKWNMRTEHTVGFQNVIGGALVPTEKILLPPLHVKLGIVKNFISQIAKQETVYACLRQIFPRLSEAKLKKGMYIFKQFHAIL